MNEVAKVNYFLEPGYICFDKGTKVIQAVLGSGVAVCLWDSKRKYGGMSHFVYPRTKDSKKATPVYGNVAIIALIKMIKELGSSNGDIKAHIIGGGHPEDILGNNNIGLDNIKIAQKILNKKGIVIASEDVGGIMGKKVVFDTETGQIIVMKVHKIREEDWRK